MLFFLKTAPKATLTFTLLSAVLLISSSSSAAKSAKSDPARLDSNHVISMDKMDKHNPIIATEEQNGWGNILKKYTKSGPDNLVRFDYGALNSSPQDMIKLAAYIEMLSVQKPSTFEREKAVVYWANLYNAVTVLVVTENYPVSSILKIRSGIRPGPWKRKLVNVEGQKLSLDNIEHDIMRPQFKASLVHYMVNCASIGCPNLKPTPWRVENLEFELDRAARGYINSSRGVQIKDGKVAASKIYKWYKQDFGGNQTGVLEHVRQYANPELLAALKGKTRIKSYIYDWNINNKQTAAP